MNYGQGNYPPPTPPGYTQQGYPAANPYGAPPGYPTGMPMPPPKSNVGLIIGIIAGVLGLGLIVFLVLVFAVFKAAASDSSSNELTLAFLQNVARESSRGLPRMLDAETREEAVTAQPGTLVYHHRLVNKSVSQLSVPMFTQLLKPPIVSNDCGTPAVRNGLLMKGATLRYSYVDKYGAFIANIDVTKHDCGI